jgi:hypothetical protein
MWYNHSTFELVGGCAMYTLESKNYYVRSYLIDKSCTGGVENVLLIAECHDAPKFPKDGRYSLNIWLQVGNIGMRNFVIGIIFGHREYTQAQLNVEIDSVIEGEVSQMGNIAALVEQLIHDSNVCEQHPYDPGQH